MIISVNWLKKFTEIDGRIDEVAALIGSRLVEIEEVIDLGKKYEGVVIVQVKECSPLEGSDHLNFTKIDDGGIVKDVERDENGLVQVVCGAPNVKAGMTVAWLPPKSTVPSTFKDSEPFVLDARKLRGVMSNGMLASAKELDLFDDHTGILEIDKDLRPGSSFAEAYELDDYLFDIENKSLTHRPDTFGLIGFAREVAAIQGKQFETPKALKSTDPEWKEKTGNEPTPKVTIDDPELAGRYQAVVLANVDAKIQSPLETQTYLSRIGVRPHSAVVDATNYLMMLTGQPLHAFDYDKLKAVNNGEIDIHVRAGRKGEKLALLDGREIELTEGDIVIANGDTAVALAGAMGGANTEVDDNTTNILLESATFNLYNLRNTQFRHGIFSEAITRFTKGQPAALTAPVLAEAVALLQLSAGAQRASDVAEDYPGKIVPQPIKLSLDRLNTTLGSAFDMQSAVDTLKKVEFDVASEASDIVATAPYWRSDIHIPEDLIEEIGRINGFDTITPVLPKRDFTAVSPSQFDKVRARIRHTLVRAGANEVLTYSFVNGDLFEKTGQNPANAYRIVNSISPDLQYYRQSLIPSLLNLVHPNIKAGYSKFALFELNKVHAKELDVDDANLPNEQNHLGLVIADKSDGAGAPYYQAKAYLEFLARHLNIALRFEAMAEKPDFANAAPFEYRRSAFVYAGNDPIGIIGEFRAAVIKSFKLPRQTAGFAVDTDALVQATERRTSSYEPLSRYPSTERDICFQVTNDVSYQQVVEAADSALSGTGLAYGISPVDIYQANNSSDKNITVRISLTSYEKTLSGDEITALINEVSQTVIGATAAKII